MVQKLFVIIAFMILAASTFAVVYAQTPGSGNNVDFIVFSDTHIGLHGGLDNLTADKRYGMLIQNTNKIDALFMVNVGDLVDGPTTPDPAPYNFTASYALYNSLSQCSNKPILNVKGNHDSNNTIYSQMIGPMNWALRYGDILVVGIGSVAEGGNWEENVSYNQATIDFLNRTVNSQLYTETTYHFLFEHYPPATTWPCVYGGNCGIPSTMWSFYPYFYIIFCGHEGGIEYATSFQGTPVVKDAHLGDGKVKTDTYLMVTINPDKNITVISNNFVTGYKYTLCSVPLDPYNAVIQLQDYDMDAQGEFQLTINKKTVYVCPPGSMNNNRWITWQLNISQYIQAGTNTVTFANPSTAHSNTIKNLTVKVNNITVVSDARTHCLQNSSVTYTFSVSSVSR